MLDLDVELFFDREEEVPAVALELKGEQIVCEEAGQELRRIQTGKVQQYGAWLFGGAVMLAAVLVVFG